LTSLAPLRVVDKELVSANQVIRLAENNSNSGFDHLPRLDGYVTSVGFPCSDQISVTRGLVYRIDVNSYGVLRIQIDVAINPGK